MDRTPEMTFPTPSLVFTTHVNSPAEAPARKAMPSERSGFTPLLRNTENRAAPNVNEPSTVRSGKPVMRTRRKTPSAMKSIAAASPRAWA